MPVSMVEIPIPIHVQYINPSWEQESLVIAPRSPHRALGRPTTCQLFGDGWRTGHAKDEAKHGISRFP